MHQLILPSLLLAAAPLAAQAPARAPDLPVDPAVRTGVLPNGLTYYIRANSEPRDRVELRLAIDAGSVLESDDQRGLAHVLEHMAFNGTTNFEAHELVDYLESIGMRFGPDVNAYTSYDETVYTLTLPTDSAGVVETGLRILEDWAGGIRLDSTQVEKERDVVMEEWRLGRGAGARLRAMQFPVLTRGSRYAQRDPIGTPESLAGFEHEALRRFHRDWYRPDLMAVIVVGDVDPRRMEALVRERFGGLRAPANVPPRAEFRVPGHERTLVSVETDPEANGSSVSLYLKRDPVDLATETEHRQWLVQSLAASLLTNRLMEKTQIAGSGVLDVSSFQGRFLRPLAALVFSVRAPDGSLARGFEALLTEIERASRHGFLAAELEREKRTVLRQYERRFAERERITSAGYAGEYVADFLYGGVPISVETEYELYRRLIPGVEVEEVDAAAREWKSTADRVVLVQAPEDAPVPEASDLEVLAAAIEAREVPPYAEALTDAPLLDPPPQPGRVIAERELEVGGALEWRLSNGARIVLMPTDFRDDEVLFAARSPGGLSLLSERDRVPAVTAAAVAQIGGAGELSTIDLQKRLTGTVAGVGAEIGATYEGLSGAAAVRDLELLFQLVHLRFTEPRADSAAFLAYREQLREALANRLASPEAFFADTLRRILTRNDPRARPLDPADVDSLDLRRSLEIYRERFADAADFSFYLVGTFDTAAVRPLVERYIASLPSAGGAERARDLGVRTPERVVRTVVRRGAEEKAIARIIFSGDEPVGPRELQRLSALAELLRIRLREVLREELGGTYGVSVSASARARPASGYQLSIGFGAAPQRVQALADTALAEIATLRRTGPHADEVAKVREILRRARETDRRLNFFWISQIVSLDSRGWALAEIDRYDGYVDATDADTLRDAALRYLDPGRYVRAVLLPKTAGDARGPELAGGNGVLTSLPASRGPRAGSGANRPR